MKSRVVILGGGFAGFYVALYFERILQSRQDIEVTLVDQENFFLFTPMLHEIAAGDLSFNEIVYSLRKVFKRVKFYQAQIQLIDKEKQRIDLSYGEHPCKFSLEYDFLLICLGSVTNFSHFKGDGKRIFTIKTLGDAVYLRNHIIAKLEEAELEDCAENRKKKLTFVVAGGGFAGVETIAAINDFVRESIKYYPHLADKSARLVLVHAHKPILPEFDSDLGHYAQKKLSDRGVEIITNEEVKSYNNSIVLLNGGKEINSDTLIWTAGVSASPLIENINSKKKHGRLVVNDYLQIEEQKNIWVAGDCAYILNKKNGQPYPPTAQHALREGKLAALNILKYIDKQPMSPFKYQSLGKMAAIGKRTGVGDILGIKVAGLIGWFLWRTIYWSKLPGVDRKVRVGISWMLDLIFPPDLVQYISTSENKPVEVKSMQLK